MANYDSTHTGATIDSAVSQVTDSTTDFNVDSNTLVVDKSANSVGIGTASPAVLTHLSPGGSYGDNPTLRISMTQADGYRPYLSLDNTHTGGREYQLTSTNDSDGAYSGGKFVIVDADDSGAARLVIDSSGNVGIGADSPATEMSAGTFLEIKKASGIAGLGLNGGGSSRWELTSDTGDDFKISRNGSTAMTIDGSNNNVGIGTAAPDTLLELKESSNGAGDAVLRLRGHGNNADNTVLGELQFYNADGSADQPGVVASVKGKSGHSTGSRGELAFYTHDGDEGGEGSSPVERMRIDSAGSVGIGTGNPDYLLHVSSADATAYAGDSINNDGGTQLTIENTYTGALTSFAALRLINNGTGSKGNARIACVSDADNEAELAFTVEDGGNYVEAMRIDKDGNVGIGIDSPGYPLHIKGGSAHTYLAIDNSADGYDATLLLRQNNGTKGLVSYDDSSNTMSFIYGTDPSATTGIHIDSSGYVGIGSESPASTLDVHGIVSVGNDTQLTIASGAITVTQSSHQVDTEGDASSDDVDTINGGVTGAILILRSQSSSRDVTFKDATGNLHMAGDFTCTSTGDSIMFYFGGSNWHEISRSNNA